MTAINFPDNPTPGEEFTAAGRTWVWNDTAGVWETVASSELPPLAHAASHEAGGTDELELAQSQVTGLATSLAGKVSQTDGTVTTATPSSAVVRNITLSLSQPSGGIDGDVWLVYS